MWKYIRIGVDIAKNSFQVHALESEDCSATKRKLSRSGTRRVLPPCMASEVGRLARSRTPSAAPARPCRRLFEARGRATIEGAAGPGPIAIDNLRA